METASARFAIGVLSTRTGCHVETIRYYERAGLLPAPERTGSGYRRYGTVELRRLAFIRRARALGFSIKEIRALLGLADHTRRPCAEARLVAAAHLEDVRSKIADLTQTVARCGDVAGRHCPRSMERVLIEALHPAAPAPSPRMPARRAGGRVTAGPGRRRGLGPR